MGAVEKIENSQPKEGLDQVREIIVGAQLRELERKIARLESRASNDVEDLRKEITRRLSDLEAYVRGEVEGLSARVDDERNARLEADAQQGKELRETAATIELRTNRIDDAGTRGLREMRRMVLEQSKSLLAEVGRARDELIAMLEPPRIEPQSTFEGDRPSMH